MDRGLAKRWIKRRLVVVFPELRYDPVALERAYRDLSLEVRPGGIGDMQTYFEVISPESLTGQFSFVPMVVSFA